MKTLLGVLLIFCCQVLMAGCPTDESLKYTYMTKEELIKSYCVAASDGAKAINDNQVAMADWNEFFKMLEAGNILAKIVLDFCMSRMERAAEILWCSNHDKGNIFRLLREYHGIEKEEDIKCE